MGVPAAAGMHVNALYNIVDTIFVGQGVGPTAIAALSIVFPIQMIASSLAQALGVGAASVASRRLGEKRPEDAAKTIGTAYTAVFAITLVLIALLLAFLRPILTFFGASGTIMPYASEYTSIVGSGSSSRPIHDGEQFAPGEGNAKASMTGMVMGPSSNACSIRCSIFVFDLGVAAPPGPR
jgi:Na+-driven multidrug efflux pump